MFLWACDRYRADIRMVWEKCVAIMSNDDVDEGKPQPGIFPLLCLCMIVTFVWDFRIKGENK